MYYENCFDDDAENSSSSKQKPSMCKQAWTSKIHSTMMQDAIKKKTSHRQTTSKSHTTQPTQNRQHDTPCLIVMEDSMLKIFRYLSIQHVLLECTWDLLVINWVAAEEVKERIMWCRIVDHGVEGPMVSWYRPSCWYWCCWLGTW